MNDDNGEITKIWRPSQFIKIKALGLLWRRDAFLACKVYDDSGALKGIRPQGGSIKFNETRSGAVIREFSEAFGLNVVPSGIWRTYENLFIHEGLKGHEIIFVVTLKIVDPKQLEQDNFKIREKSGVVSLAQWFSRESLLIQHTPLFPVGLLNDITKI